MLDLLCATPVYVGKRKRNILFFLSLKILWKVKALRILVHFYHMYIFSLCAFQPYNSCPTQTMGSIKKKSGETGNR